MRSLLLICSSSFTSARSFVALTSSSQMQSSGLLLLIVPVASILRILHFGNATTACFILMLSSSSACLMSFPRTALALVGFMTSLPTTPSDGRDLWNRIFVLFPSTSATPSEILLEPISTAAIILSVILSVSILEFFIFCKLSDRRKIH